MSASPRQPLVPVTACPNCGRSSASPFSTGGVCLRCAGERVLAVEMASSAGALTHDAGEMPPAPASGPTHRIGAYEIIEVLGRGGMGCVYAARQIGLGRIVALKAIPAGGPGTADLELRFLREAHTIAKLRHPYIVTVHDFGRADGCAYLAMDYIEGGDLARRLRERVLTPVAAAALMQKVADALAYTHAAGVLHRDLKPSNILLDGDDPRVADFGLAAQLETGGDLTTGTKILGTPQYLAPEAIAGGSGALSVASDVYALGAVLFETLTGRTPYAGVSPAELPAVMARSEPSSLRLLAPAVPRDLETIALKCLEHEPARRYASAAALADDLRRFLAGEPIAARPPGAFDLVRRFARRHRVAFAAGGLIALVLLVATGISTWLAVRATRAEKLASAEAETSKELTSFLQNDLLAQASPGVQPDRDLKLRAALDRAEPKIQARFSDRPLIEAAIRETLGRTYDSLGEYAMALRQLERTTAIRREQLGPEHPLTLRSMILLAEIFRGLGRFKDAENLGRQTLTVQRRVLGTHDRETLHSMNSLAATLVSEGKRADATALQTEALDMQRRELGPDDPETLTTMNDLAANYHEQGRLDLATRFYLQTLSERRRVLGPEHPDTVRTMSNLASIYWQQGKLAQAEALSAQTLDIFRRVLGPEHPDTVSALNSMASTYWNEGKLAEAEPLHVQVLEISRRTQGPEHPLTLAAMHNLAFIYQSLGKSTEAEALMARTVELRKHILGSEQPDTLRSMSALAGILLEERKLDEAAALFGETLAIRQRVLGPEHPDTWKSMGAMTTMFIAQKKFPEAESLARQTLAIRRKVSGSESIEAVVSLDSLGDLLILEEKFDEAEKFLRESVETRAKLAPDAWRTAYTQSQLGAVLLQLKQFGAAEPLLVGAYERLARLAATIPPNKRAVIRTASTRVGQLYVAWDKPAQAEAWAKKTAEPPP